MKAHTTITLDVDALVIARKKKVNLSGVFNDYLRTILKLDEESNKTKEDIKSNINVLAAELHNAQKELEMLEKVQEENRPLRVYTNEA